jgi:two-component system sensor histidine kinase KdpD
MEVFAAVKRMKFRWIDLLISLVILITAFGISLLLQRLHPSESLVSLVFVLAVFLISLLTSSYLWGILASLSSVLIDNFVFTFPYFAFDFISTDNLISALVMLLVSVITSTLTTQLKEQERMKLEAETEKMRGNLLRAISHDLRTPLTTIYGSCSAIIDNYDSIPRHQQLKLLSEMREDSESLVRMVENLLSVTRVDDETILVRKTDTVLEELIDSVLLKLRKHYPEQQITVSIPDAFISIPMDAMLIQQVLINLLENAIFHATGMTVLALTVTTEGNHAIFEVADNGCGIPREKLPKLFTGQLYGTETPTDDRRNGMGIGLSVCAAIIRAHGGQITAENQRSGGALFRFRLELEDIHE